jgi:hypothetical protein
LEHAGALPLERLQHCLAIHVKLGAHIGQRKEGATIDARLTVDVDNPIVAPQTGLQDALKQKIPVQNVVLGRVEGVETDIPVWVFGSKPLGAVVCKGTIDDMGDAPLIDEARGQEGPRSHEDAGMEVGRRLAKVVRNRD